MLLKNLHIVKLFILFINIPLQSLTLEEKIGQLFIVPVWPTQGKEHLQSVHNLLKEKCIGGVLFSIGKTEELEEIIQTLPNNQEIPLWTFLDAEWGIGMRLTDVPNLPKNLTLGAIQDLGLLKAFGLELASQCHSVGIWGNFAPVVDINSNSKNPIIGQRSFGDDPDEVTRRSLSVMEGMQKGGVLACVKHFPGHGDTAVDSHQDLPKINKSLGDLNKLELVPFKALIDRGVDMVMLGHLHVPALSKEPASLSYEIITGLLRKTLGFKGLVVTDALNMGALSCNSPSEEVFVKALLAGADLLLTNPIVAEELPELLETISRAIERIKIAVPEEIIDERVKRILEAKKRVLPPLPKSNPNLRRILYRNALTRLGERRVLGDVVALVQSRPDPDFERYLSRYTNLKVFSFEEIEEAEEYVDLIVSIRKEDTPPELPSQAILALFTTPYVLENLSYRFALIGYEDEVEVKEAVSDALFGKLTPLGKLPIRLSREKGSLRDGRGSSNRKIQI